MSRKFFTVVMFGIVSSAALFAAGCSSGSQPRSLTGSTEASELARWTDPRGHYHPDWRNGINTPPGYPRDFAR